MMRIFLEPLDHEEDFCGLDVTHTLDQEEDRREGSAFVLQGLVSCCENVMAELPSYDGQFRCGLNDAYGHTLSQWCIGVASRVQPRRVHLSNRVAEPLNLFEHPL